MKRNLLLLIAVLLLTGCTQKYVKIVLEDGSHLTVNGNVDPSFMRENTKESIATEPELKIPVVPQ